MNVMKHVVFFPENPPPKRKLNTRAIFPCLRKVIQLILKRSFKCLLCIYHWTSCLFFVDINVLFTEVIESRDTPLRSFINSVLDKKIKDEYIIFGDS